MYKDDPNRLCIPTHVYAGRYDILRHAYIFMKRTRQLIDYFILLLKGQTSPRVFEILYDFTPIHTDAVTAYPISY